jgi:hypothetical protein
MCELLAMSARVPTSLSSSLAELARQLPGNPAALPAAPPATLATPGSTSVSTVANQAKQLCPGPYGAISLGTNSVLNLNGGVYQLSKLCSPTAPGSSPRSRACC